LFTANEIIRLGADNTRIYPTLVIKGTKLEKLYRESKYAPLSLSDAVEWTKIILSLFTKNGIDVIRVGLHPSEGLLNGHELTAGPFHVSFKELVLTELWKDLINEQLNENKNDILIKVAPEQLNHAVGYKSSNKKMLEMKFQKVKFVSNPFLKEYEFDVVYN
jgi:histone acetyltransferase (RNA polymerase elongator complex component)